MPRKDLVHDAVKSALINDGWTITHDPLSIGFGGFDFYIDLGAELLLGANKDGQQIAVEIKSFSGTSTVTDFHNAVGQFVNYRLILEQKEPERILYLAVTEYMYVSFLETSFGQLAIEGHKLKLIVFDEQEEVIVRWIE